MKNSKVFKPAMATCFILLFSLIIFSCKKEETDDPNINYVTINKSVTSLNDRISIIDSVDLNGDSKFDFIMLAGSNAPEDTAVIYISCRNSAVHIDSTQNYSILYKIKALNAGVKPNIQHTSFEWYSVSFVAAKTGPLARGYAGAGDVFVPVWILNQITAKKHYGWLRMNVSSDFHTLKIIDGAFHINPDTPIEMGSK